MGGVRFVRSLPVFRKKGGAEAGGGEGRFGDAEGEQPDRSENGPCLAEGFGYIGEKLDVGEYLGDIELQGASNVFTWSA